MLDYEWGNPSTIMLAGEEPNSDPDHTRHHQILDQYTQQQPFSNEILVHPNGGFAYPQHHNFHHHIQPQTTTQAQFQSLCYDPRAYLSPMLSLEPVGQNTTEFMMLPKSETVGGLDFTNRIGLNLGGRTYFSSEDDDFVSRLYRRSRGMEPGSANSPRCQAEGCNADLTHVKHYHRRHKVCEFHSKAATVITAGMTQRFCQQCSRFHLLSEFDNGKRSCRKRLADHNRRRRKNRHPPLNPDHENKPQQHHLVKSRTPPSSDNLGRSSPEDESTVQGASSSVTTLAILA